MHDKQQYLILMGEPQDCRSGSNFLQRLKILKGNLADLRGSKWDFATDQLFSASDSEVSLYFRQLPKRLRSQHMRADGVKDANEIDFLFVCVV